MKILTPERLDHLRTAAGVGQRMAGLQPHTVHVDPDELAALVDRDASTVVDEVKTAIAGQCSCFEGGCVHDLIRAAVGDPLARIEQLEVQLAAATEKDTTTNTSVGILRVRNWSLCRDLRTIEDLVKLARGMTFDPVGLSTFLDEVDRAARQEQRTAATPSTAVLVAATAVPSTSREPCDKCGEHHRLDQFEIGARVIADSKRATVVEWGQYAGPLWVRVEFDRQDAHDDRRRDNYAPCELREEPF